MNPLLGYRNMKCQLENPEYEFLSRFTLIFDPCSSKDCSNISVLSVTEHRSNLSFPLEKSRMEFRRCAPGNYVFANGMLHIPTDTVSFGDVTVSVFLSSEPTPSALIVPQSVASRMGSLCIVRASYYWNRELWCLFLKWNEMDLGFLRLGMEISNTFPGMNDFHENVCDESGWVLWENWGSV